MSSSRLISLESNGAKCSAVFLLSPAVHARSRFVVAKSNQSSTTEVTERGLHTRAAVSARAAAADARGRTNTVQPINSPRACRRENTRNQAIAGIRLDPGPSAAAPCRRIQPITLGGAKQNEQESQRSQKESTLAAKCC